MHSEAKYQVVVRGSLPVDLARDIAEAHALAVRIRSVKAVEQGRTQALPGWDDSNATEDGLDRF